MCKSHKSQQRKKAEDTVGNLASIESNTIAYRGAGMYGDVGIILFLTIFCQNSGRTLCESGEADFPKHIHTPSHQYFWYYVFDLVYRTKKKFVWVDLILRRAQWTDCFVEWLGHHLTWVCAILFRSKSSTVNEEKKKINQNQTELDEWKVTSTLEGNDHGCAAGRIWVCYLLHISCRRV